jgi:hypothetical protein
MNLEQCIVERRTDGVVLVRVRSRPAGNDTLPDAVFTFRPGDPQFKFWDRQAPKPQPVGR